MKLIIAAGVLSLLGTLVGTKFFIDFLIRRHYGQFVRDDGPQSHNSKRGTPTMGGAVIVSVAVLSYALAHLITWEPVSYSGILLLGLLVACGLLGFIDDWTKISHKRSLGLTSRGKLIGQLAIGAAFGVLSLVVPNAYGDTPASRYISFTRDIEWLRMPVVVAVVWMTLLVIASSNAVNLTDGVDGLATGSLTMVFGAYTLINIWQRNQWCRPGSTSGPLCYDVRDPWDLAVIAAAMAAACFGFLWWNAKPAKIFMGDTGSLALGGAVGGLAILTRTELLLIVLGLLFVVEAASVMIQVSYFKVTHGKRVFKMAPLHHHFELLGWDEVTVVIRFWIICGTTVVAGLALFYAQWVLGMGIG
ncbi:phospho-N-acetylmuramoyl-pentapeptide-transferase [Propionibacterium sp. oral taxon 192 str. F0372]|uniref:phospho-N-acetylmuramoyl-pentapeptide- transferase n=1 Tax=Propionibacterium sp. oral taxon 192 TaxID=671222 RepID=UPI00035420B7|nr:phospho-N-acetylmuramoyl-pentapeptide-transferase [Propionibacterium sp. oral taxon 192]EPH02614.1 phospho-N-acetylmuramoyl-pentapeptide-transferase [Propionibacterium sp. oral taxon 192 str. F0372]